MAENNCVRRKNQNLEVAEWFLTNAPKGTGWRDRQFKLGLFTLSQYEEVLRDLIDQACLLAEEGSQKTIKVLSKRTGQSSSATSFRKNFWELLEISETQNRFRSNK